VRYITRKENVFHGELLCEKGLTVTIATKRFLGSKAITSA